MKRIEDMNYYEILEIGQDATAQDIHRAYERVRKIYEPNSIALYSLFSPEEARGITKQIEEAYRTLFYEETRKIYDMRLNGAREHDQQPAALRPEAKSAGYIPKALTARPLESASREPAAASPCTPPPAVQPPLKPLPATITECTGPALKVLREQQNLSIRQLADYTKLGTRYIEFLEDENFAKLPARAYIRGFMTLYAKALGYEPEQVVSDYLKRFDEAQQKKRL